MPLDSLFIFGVIKALIIVQCVGVVHCHCTTGSQALVNCHKGHFDDSIKVLIAAVAQKIIQT